MERQYSLSTCTLVGIGAICPPLVAFRLASYGWRGFFVSPFRAVDENSEPKLLCQEDTDRAREKALARNNWICFIGKVLVCVYVHVSNNQTPSDTEAKRVSGRDGGLCF